VEGSARVGAQFVELHTGSFAEHFNRKKERADELRRLIEAARLAHSLGVKVNAGHGLNTLNVPALFEVPHLVELNIGHTLVSRAITVGLAVAVKEMLLVMERYGAT
jgi:pyridoxine 5-phosphate synthase